MGGGVLDATFASLDALRASLREVGVQVTLWANPEISRASLGERVSAQWPLLEFDAMLLWCAIYAGIVAYGYFARAAFRARAAAEKTAPAARPATADAPPAAPAAWSWAATSAKLARDPLKSLMVLYNAVQVLVCGAMCVDVLLVVLDSHYYPANPLSPFCTGHRWRREHKSGVARVHWVFYVSKLLDFADTIFIIARDKWEQFIPLHVYHHLSVFPVQWLIQTAAPDGDAWWPVFANAFVHVVMVRALRARGGDASEHEHDVAHAARATGAHPFVSPSPSSFSSLACATVCVLRAFRAGPEAVVGQVPDDAADHAVLHHDRARNVPRGQPAAAAPPAA